MLRDLLELLGAARGWWNRYGACWWNRYVATVYIARTAAICWRMMMKFVRLTQLIDVIYEATRSTLLQSMSMKLLYVSGVG